MTSCDRDVEFLGEESGGSARCRARPPCRPPCGAAGRENSRSAQTIASSGLVMQITKASGALRLDALADRLHHLEVDAEQIVAAHARLAGDAGGDDDDVGAGDVGIIVGALELRVEAFDRAALREIERLALRHALDDVEQDDVAQFLLTRRDGRACRRYCRRRSARSCCEPWGPPSQCPKAKGPQDAASAAPLSPLAREGQPLGTGFSGSVSLFEDVGGELAIAAVRRRRNR